MARTASIPVYLSKPGTDAATVDYRTVDGTAKAPAHYTAKSGTLSFVAGQTVAMIEIELPDALPNQIERQFTVELSAATGSYLDAWSTEVVIPATKTEDVPLVDIKLAG